jgi:hypothetical protein
MFIVVSGIKCLHKYVGWKTCHPKQKQFQIDLGLAISALTVEISDQWRKWF